MARCGSREFGSSRFPHLVRKRANFELRSPSACSNLQQQKPFVGHLDCIWIASFSSGKAFLSLCRESISPRTEWITVDTCSIYLRLCELARNHRKDPCCSGRFGVSLRPDLHSALSLKISEGAYYASIMDELKTMVAHLLFGLWGLYRHSFCVMSGRYQLRCDVTNV